jgi:TIR domain
MSVPASTSGEAPPRAFLSHSSEDAHLVRLVAAQVGRPFVKLDYYEFHSGDEILLAIDTAIEQSSIFVLFASRRSLASLWVGSEVDSARYETKFGRLTKVLVCILDDTLRPDDLPSWMRRYKFVASRAAKPIARMIRGEIDDLMRERQHSVFVNRAQETDDLQELLAPSTGAPSAQVFAVVGLDGIGRRTLLQRVARDTLSLPRLLLVEIESGDSINDLAVKIADLVEPASSSDEAIELAREIELMSAVQAADRAARDLRTALVLGELPTLIDRGGMLDRDGQISPAIKGLLVATAVLHDLPIALVSPRRPRFANSDPVPGARLTELSGSDVRRLVGLLARQRRLELSPEDVASLSSMTRGYPPSARYAVELAGYYGVPVTLAHTAGAAEFRMRPIRSYLRTLDLKPEAKTTLRVLAGASCQQPFAARRNRRSGRA